MMTAEQAEREAERRFPEYRAEAMSTCGVYRIALAPRAPEFAASYDPIDPRLYSEGSSYEGALAAAAPPDPAALQRKPPAPTTG
ncbi:MAG: hypothetical protein ABJB12_17830 [Pseudomonadota bacterium]